MSNGSSDSTTRENNTNDRVVGSNASPVQTNIEEQPGRLNKWTQSDISQSSWKLPYGTAYRSRPTSVTCLPKQGHYQASESSYSSYSPKNTLFSAQSELILSPRSRYGRYVTVDMRPMGGTASTGGHQSPGHAPPPPFPPFFNNPPYTCCCACMGPQIQQQPAAVSSNPGEDQDGPEGLSWRRLHMSRAKLKATATTSELLSGFAMVAMVELQINDPTAVPEWLFVMFAVCTTVLVSVHIFALMITHPVHLRTIALSIELSIAHDLHIFNTKFKMQEEYQ